MCLILINAQANDCSTYDTNISLNTAKNGDELVSQQWIYDGDTLQLTDQRKIRLLGINTPEIGRKGKKSQAYAEQAKKKLEQLLAQQKNIRLRYDVERQDKYGRTLAYAYLIDGRDIQAELLKSGLAISIVIAPNALHLVCYRELEKRARELKKGLWSLPQYQWQSANNLRYRKPAYRLITGRVTDIRERGIYTLLVLDNRLQVLLPQQLSKDLKLKPRLLLGKQVQVRGWLKKRKGLMQIKVFHAANFNLL